MAGKRVRIVMGGESRFTKAKAFAPSKILIPAVSPKLPS
ncbi:Uncharacterised protein [Vibrio cholerae]|nr:Uncharacterised protein [Vibrio cholerae]